MRLVVFALAVALSACGGSTSGVRDPASREERAALELERAAAAEESRKPAQARKHYRAALEMAPEDYETHRRASLFFRGVGEPATALDIAKGYVDRVPGDPRGYHLLADVQFANGDDRAAIATLGELITIDDEDASAHHKRGEVFMHMGDVARARVDFERASSLQPDSADYLTSYAFSLTRVGRGQSLNKAESLLKRALEIEPDHPDATRLYGTALRAHFEPERALEYHERAVTLAPKSALAHFELGITYNALGRNSDAEASLRRSLELDPNDPVSWYAFGEILRITGQCARAIPAYEKSLELDADQSKASSKLGVCYVDQKRYDKAEVVLSAAIQRDPKDPYGYFNLAVVYERSGRENAAIKAYNRFLELAPAGDGDIDNAKRKIAELQKKIRSRY